MKKIFLLLAIAIQFSIAQTNPVAGEYISQDTPTSGVNLILGNDNTYHIAIFSGKYTVKNDSIYFESGKDENYFNLKFEKGKPAKQITVSIEPSNLYSLLYGIHLGTQEKENGPISYKGLSDYFEENELEEFTNNLYDDAKNEEDKKLSFTLPRPYALYFVNDKNSAANVEKYVVPSDVNTVSVGKSYNSIRDLELSGTIDDDKTLTIVADGKNAIKFQHKNSIPKADFIQPISKSKIKNWTYDGKKDRYEFLADSTAVDTTTVYADYEYNEETDYKFAAKVETNFEEALKNLKSKYLVLYYNPKSKNQQKEFDEIIEEYNESVSYDMYDGYKEEYDKFNFYAATSKDEKFLKANGITKFPITVILDDKKQVIATSKTRYSKVATNVNHYNFIDKIETAQKAKHVDEILSSKIVDNAKLLQVLTDNDSSFYNRFLQIPYNVYVEDYVEDYDVATDSAAVVVEAAAVDYNETDFEFYSIKTSQAAFNQKLKDIFNAYQLKKLVDENLIGVLLNEVIYHQNSRKFFDKENTISIDDVKKYLAYAINYNGDATKKTKILNEVAMYVMNLEDSIAVTFEEISKNNMVNSNHDIAAIKAYLEVIFQKSSEVDNITNIINQLYVSVNANNALFNNLNAKFEEVNDIYARTSEWDELKNYYAKVFALAAEFVVKHKATMKYNDVQKWLDCANVISKNNIQVCEALYNYNLEVGNTTKANEVKVKLDVLKAKEEENRKLYQD